MSRGQAHRSSQGIGRAEPSSGGGRKDRLRWAGRQWTGIESLECRLLLSGLADFLNPPAFVSAPSDLGQPGPTQAAVADTQERRDLIYLAQNVPTAEFPVLAQVDTPLLLLYSRWLQGSTQPVGENTIYGTPYGELFSTDGARPHVQAFVESAVVARSALEALGMQVTAVTATADWQVVAGYLPVDAIDDAAHLAGLGVLQASERGTTEAQGAASNQWETVSCADQLKRILPSVDGNEANIDGRIEIGVISDSMNQVGNGVADSQNSGDLPLGNRVQVLDDGPAGGKDEGRAMAELIYDIGPEFNILFHSAGDSAADMAAAYDELRQAGADIITEDVTFFREPVFQDGQIAGAVDSVYLNHGVLVFGAAGNYNNRSYHATWRDDDGDGFHEFADGDETLRLTLANGEKFRVYLQWSQLWALGTTDIDLQLFSADLSTLLAESNDDNNPPLLGVGDFGFGTPLETLTYTNNSGAAAVYQLAFRFEDGTAPDGLTLQMFAREGAFTEAYTQNQPGIPGNHAAANMFTLGAVRYPFPWAIEDFSSHGPQTLFFGAGGFGVPEVREKPDFVAADGVDTSFFGGEDRDRSGFNDFYGTSAAAPNAAAVAGLVLDAANRRLTYDELSQIFAGTATGTGAGAWDPAFGEGLINALGAGLVARGFCHDELYAELNPFGDYTNFGTGSVLSANTDTDGYAFAFDSDGQVAIGVQSGGAGLEPGLILWNSESGSFVEIDYNEAGWIGAGFFSSRIQRELASWELHQAEVFEGQPLGGNSEWCRLVIDGPEPQRTAIGLDAQGDGIARGAMEDRRDTDYFTIVAPETAGNELTVILTPEATLDGVLTLYDADGDELARQDAAAAGQAETIAFGNIVKGATYYLRVGAARYASAGAYELEVAFEMALPGAMTDAEGFAYFHFDGTSHDTQTFSDFAGKADITDDVDVDSFFFAGEAAGEYTVSVTPRSGDVAPLVAVYHAATGELLGATATAAQGTTRELRLPLAAWTRYIVAVADDDRSGTGDVEIVIQGPEVLATTPIAIGPGGSGALANRTLDVPEDSDYFRFTAPADANGTLTVTVSPWAGLDAAAILFDVEGHELAKSYLPGAGADEVVAFIGVTPSTTYYLTVLSKDYADEGSYDVSLQFGLVRGSIRGTKFYDLDQDGVFDETEPGLAGWVIYIDRDGDKQLDLGEPFDETDPGGAYALEDLPLGTHQVLEVLTGGWKQTAPGAEFHSIELSVAAPDAAGLDFGNFAPPQIHGLKWDDLDGDGTRDPGEPGLANWTIYLDTNPNGQRDPQEPVAVTNKDGDYWFAGLAAGPYVAAEVLPADWARTHPASPGTHAVEVVPGVLADGFDFGNYRYGVAGGVVYNDLDAGGTREPDEPTFGGWIAFVDLDGDGNRTAGDPWDMTDPGGLYRIENVPPGTWKVRLAQPAGYAYTDPAIGYHEIVFLSGTVRGNLDFGNLELLDFGDAPAPYPTLLADDGPRHRITGSALGPIPDAESDGRPSASADGDDTTGADDEEGITFLTALVPGQLAEVRANAFRDGTLDAWLDFNRDGDWDDAGERIVDHESLEGATTLSFHVPGWSVPGHTYARFRFSEEGVASYTGAADFGEVEDYRVEIENPFNVPLVVPPLEDYGPMNQFGVRSVTLTLHSPTDHATWRLATKSGGPATFTANADPSSGLHPLLALYNGKGDLVAVGSSGSDLSECTLSYTLTPGVDEVYTILVQDAESDTAGVVQSSFFTPSVSPIDTIAVDAAGLGTAVGTVVTFTIPSLADVDYYQLAAVGGGQPELSNRLAVKVTPVQSYRLEFQLFNRLGDPVGGPVRSPEEGHPAEHVYTGLSGGPHVVAVFSSRFEDHPVGGDYRIEVDFDTYDFGDAPASYSTLLADNGPSHLIVPGFYLGSGVDNEWEGQPGAEADGDDSAGSDDEDGVVFLAAMSPGHPTPIQVTASAAGMLDAWVDFNADGDFGDPGERVFASEPLVAGPNNLTIDVPDGDAVGPTYARFRYSSAGGLSPKGAAADGEVEDYRVTIEPSGEIHGTVWHDINTDGTRGTAEPGLAGWTVFLDDDNDGEFDSSTEQWVQTDSGGNYAFLDVAPGAHDVAELREPGWHQVFPRALPQWVYVSAQIWRPGNLFTPAEFSHNNIYIFDQGSLELMDVFGNEELDEGLVHDIEIGPGGDVYAAVALGEGHGQIVQFTYQGEYVRTIELPDDGESILVDYPNGFDVLADGSLLVAQPTNQRIVTLNADGSILATLDVPGFRPADAGMLSDGTIVFTDGFTWNDPFEYMLNVRLDDTFWLGTSEGAQLRTTDGEVLATRGDGLVREALETADGTLFATAVIPGGPFQLTENRLVKYDADGNESGHGVIPISVVLRGWFLVDTAPVVRGLAVAGNEVPYGDGPVRGGAAPQGLAPRAETSAFLPSKPMNNGRGAWSVLVEPGKAVQGVDFGNVEYSTASGVKFNDLDGDGTRDTNEPGLDGFVVWADLDDDGVRDGREPFATTAGGGLFTIEGILPGTCKIREEVRTGWTQTAPTVGYHEAQFTSGSAVTGLEFGNRQVFHVFVVNSTADPGDGTPDAAELTLREAITAANATANLLEPDRILFDVPSNDPGHVYYHDDGVAGQVSATQITATTAAADSLLLDADPDWPHSWFTIRTGGTLPAISEAVVLDGYTQPGARANRLPIGSDAVLRIELDGSSAGSNASGVRVTGDGNTIRGLAINRFRGSLAQFSGFGIYLDMGDNNLIEGNFLGTDVAGMIDLGNATNGVFLRSSSNNRIGGTTAGARNVISGNNGWGINLFSASHNLLQGNYIGVNAAGTAALGNNHGVWIESASFNTIGGTAPRAGNVISGNSGHGIDLVGFGGNNLVAGNFIGTDPTGSIDLGNSQNGIRVEQSSNTIGGTTPGARNIISGNNAHGVQLSGTTATGNLVQGNFIGTNAAGTGALGNSGSGVQVTTGASSNTIGGTAGGAGNVLSANGRGVSIQQSAGNRVLGNLVGTQADGTTPLGNTYTGVEIVDASDNLIGGTDSGAGNTIAYSGFDGVYVLFAQSGTGNAILGNRIFSNTGLGIDLSPNNVTPNDPGDADTGANNRQNFPVLTLATATPSSTNVQGSLNSSPDTAFRVELFANVAADPAGFGEGQTYLGAIDVTTDPAGNASFAAAFPTSLPPGQFVTATATVLRSGSPPGFGDTSEFSQAVPVTAAPGEIRGWVWHDRDTDGERGTGEPGLAGWTVFLDEDDDLTLDSNERATTTDAGGNYAFLGLEPGTYNVAQVPLPNWLQTLPVVVPEWVYVLGATRVPESQEYLSWVKIFDFDLNFLEAHFPAALQDAFPNDIEIGPGGDVYVLVDGPHFGDDRIVQFTYDLEFVRDIDLVGMAHGIGFDVLADGSLLVTNLENNQWERLNPDGSVAQTGPTVPLWDVGMTSDGFLVGNHDGMINVRPDDLYWASGDSTELRDIDGTVFAERPSSTEALEISDGSLFMVDCSDGGVGWGGHVLKLDAAGEELESVPMRLEGALLWSFARALAVARNEVPYGDGPVRDGPAPQAGLRSPAASAAQTVSLAPAAPGPLPTGRGNWSVAIEAGEVVEGADFGLVELSTASGVKFHDLDGDGTRDSNEPGLDGWVVWADLNDDGVRDGREPFDTTHDGGQFSLGGLLPGTVKIREEPQAPWVQTTPAAGFLEVTVVSGSSIAGLEFGNRWPTDTTPPTIVSFGHTTANQGGGLVRADLTATFSEGVQVRPLDVALLNASGQTVPISSLSYDIANHRLAVVADNLTANATYTYRLLDTITDDALNPLDGEFDGYTFPTGNGTPGGNFAKAFFAGAAQTWLGGADDRWETNANWAGNVVPDSQITAILGDETTYDPALHRDQSVAGVNLGIAGWTVGGSGHTLTVGSGGIDSAGTGWNVVTPSVELAADSAWTVAADNTLQVSNVLNGGGHVLTKDGAGMLTVLRADTLGGLNLADGALSIGMDRSTSTIHELKIAESGGLATAKLDITNGSLVIDYTGGANPIADVRRWILQAYHGMAWDSNGITSSAAALNPITYGIGYIDNAAPDLLLRFGDGTTGPLFGNVTPVAVNLESVLVKFTYNGDVTLDGVVDDNDVTFMNLFYDGGANSTHTWWTGDIFLNDGLCDDNDITILNLTYGLGIGEPLSEGTPATAVMAPVRPAVDVAPPPGVLGTAPSAPVFDTDASSLATPDDDSSVSLLSTAPLVGAAPVTFIPAFTLPRLDGSAAMLTVSSAPADGVPLVFGAGDEVAPSGPEPVLGPDGGIVDLLALSALAL